MDERSVTGAAQRLGISQSAMSSTLARIRRLFDDPILLRSGRSMVATPVAETLIDPVRATLIQIQAALTGSRSFDPDTDQRTFVIMATGHAAVGLLHPLLVDITPVRPNIRVEIQPLDEDFAATLFRSQADLVVLPRELMASRPEIWSDEVRWEVLYRDRYVLAADKDNDHVTGAISVEEFSRMPYLAAEGTDGSPSCRGLQPQRAGHPAARGGARWLRRGPVHAPPHQPDHSHPSHTRLTHRGGGRHPTGRATDAAPADQRDHGLASSTRQRSRPCLVARGTAIPCRTTGGLGCRHRLTERLRDGSACSSNRFSALRNETTEDVPTNVASSAASAALAAWLSSLPRASSMPPVWPALRVARTSWSSRPRTATSHH